MGKFQHWITQTFGLSLQRCPIKPGDFSVVEACHRTRG